MSGQTGLLMWKLEGGLTGWVQAGSLPGCISSLHKPWGGQAYIHSAVWPEGFTGADTKQCGECKDITVTQEKKSLSSRMLAP